MIYSLQLLLQFVVYVLYLEGNKLDGTIPVGCWPMSGFLFDVRDTMAGVSEGANRNPIGITCLTDKYMLHQILVESSAYFISIN